MMTRNISVIIVFIPSLTSLS